MGERGVPEKGKEFLCRFPWPENVEEALEQLRTHKVVKAPSGYHRANLDFSGEFDWGAWEGFPPAFLWWLSATKYIRPLLLEKGRTKQDIDLAGDILKGWVESNPPDAPACSFAWDGHATAIRAENMAALYVLGCKPLWLSESMRLHASKLSDPTFHQGNWNHGLDQDMGLLALGCAMDRADWIHLARNRALENFDHSVDKQGVAHEQAVGYQYYVFLRFNDLRERLQECGYPMSEGTAERLSSMLDFCAHAVAPDGNWAELGDTPLIRANRDATDLTRFGSGSTLEFAVSGGSKGAKPLSRTAVYDAGYVFSRSGWGEERPFNKESYYTIRFGPGRKIHGHNDHMSITYHSKGQRVIVDGGFHGYTGDEMRDHFRRPEAHNVVMTADERFRWQSTTELQKYRIESNWQSYLLRDEPYRHTIRERSLLFVEDPEVIVVADRVDSSQEREYQQLWHFDRRLSLYSLGDQRTVLQKAEFKVELYQLWPYDRQYLWRGEDGNRLRGWMGMGRNRVVPVPTIATQRVGRSVTFLTIFVISAIGDAVSVSQHPVRAGGVSRMMRIVSGEKRLEVRIMDDRCLELAEV